MPTAAAADYSDWLVRPVWPKKHRIRLEAEYAGSSPSELEAERNRRHHHLPGSRQSVNSSGGRHAGTSGPSYEDALHPDDHDAGAAETEIVQTVEQSSGKYSEQEEQLLLQTLKEASRPEQVRQDFLKLFGDPKIVISAREAKELTPNFGFEPGHRGKHGHARYSLPIAESELKGQDWPGKAEQEREKKKQKKQEAAAQPAEQGGQNSDKKSSGEEGKPATSPDGDGQDGSAERGPDGSRESERNDADKSPGPASGDGQAPGKQGGPSATDQKVNREQDDDAEHGDSAENLSPPQKRFFDALVEEAKQITSFKNADGKPGPPERDGDSDDAGADGTAQVGFEIQMDDQFTPDVRSHEGLPCCSA